MSYTITAKCNGCQACAKICPVNAITGEKKGMHAVDPSGCLDCGACGRVCPQGAVLDMKGMLCVMLKRSQWKKPRIDQGLCMSCAVCVDSCPANCLGLAEASDARDLHPYPVLQREKACLGCGICQLDCPVDAISMVSP
jgi:Na+-translocating ferredoxin:NAD+ oxidoreductase subunit B